MIGRTNNPSPPRFPPPPFLQRPFLNQRFCVFVPSNYLRLPHPPPPQRLSMYDDARTPTFSFEPPLYVGWKDFRRLNVPSSLLPLTGAFFFSPLTTSVGSLSLSPFRTQTEGPAHSQRIPPPLCPSADPLMTPLFLS